MKFKSTPLLAFHIDGNMKSFNSDGSYETKDKKEVEVLKNMDGVTSVKEEVKKEGNKNG